MDYKEKEETDRLADQDVDREHEEALVDALVDIWIKEQKEERYG